MPCVREGAQWVERVLSLHLSGLKGPQLDSHSSIQTFEPLCPVWDLLLLFRRLFLSFRLLFLTFRIPFLTFRSLFLTFRSLFPLWYVSISLPEFWLTDVDSHPLCLEAFEKLAALYPL
jgi:hypothetical protein